MTDHTPDYYKMMDTAGLSAANVLTKHEPMERIISRIRMSLAQQLKEYVESIEAAQGPALAEEEDI